MKLFKKTEQNGNNATKLKEINLKVSASLINKSLCSSTLLYTKGIFIIIYTTTNATPIVYRIVIIKSDDCNIKNILSI